MRDSANMIYGLVVASALLVAMQTGIMIALGKGTIGLAVIVLAWLYFYIGTRWQRGVYGLLIYLPFAGAVTLALYPWKVPLLFKDLLFVVPTYIGFFARLSLGRGSLHGLPRFPVGLMIILGILAVVHVANPGVASLLVGLIGLKVWLFYIPLAFVSFALVTSERELFRLWRLLASLSLIPCTIGITQALLVQVGDYQTTMYAIYGTLAPLVTQEFTQFSIGAGTLARIPSTFTFVTQYFGYTLAMLVPCYALWRGDPSFQWRRLGKWAFVIVTLASFLSGARAAFVFVPLLLVLMFGLERGMRGLVFGGVCAVATLFCALVSLRIESSALYEHVSRLFFLYVKDIVYTGLMQALLSTPLGAGTGTNTGPARYAFADPDSFIAIENYYAKAAYELGFPGLLVVVSLFLALVVLGYRSYHTLQSLPLRSCAAGLLAFFVVMLLSSLKGWQIDLDPLNVYFWVFAGILMKLRVLELSINHDLNDPDEALGEKPALKLGVLS